MEAAVVAAIVAAVVTTIAAVQLRKRNGDSKSSGDTDQGNQ